MRILINALSARLGGGQTYLRNLLLNIPDGEWHIFVLCPDNFAMHDMPKNVQRIRLDIDLSNPYRRALWENLNLGKLAQSLDVKVLFSPGGILPAFGLPKCIKTVVTFQNMLPYDHVQRKRYPWGARRVRDWLLERSLSAAMRRADLVIFISRFAADFIQAAIGPLAKHSVVIPHGIAPRFFLDPTKPLSWPTVVPPGQYYLYVSFIDFYKSQIEVVRAFAALRAEGVANGTLVLAGAGYQPYLEALRAEIIDLALEDAVKLCGNLPHDQLPALYQHAQVNIFASRTENCPNILMEMMAAGRPSLVSNAEPMPEFAGDTVYYFDPADPESLANCWRQALLHKPAADSLARRAKERVLSCTWEAASNKTWLALVEACN